MCVLGAFLCSCVCVCAGCVRVLEAGFSETSGAQVRVDQTPQKGEVRTAPSGKGYSRVLTGYSRGTHGYSRGTGEVLPGYWRGPSIPRAIPAHHTLHRHGVSSPVQSVTHPSSMHSSHKHAHSPSLSRSLPPSLSCGLLACFPRHLCCGAGRWRERRPDRRGACPCLGILVRYMWRSMVLAHSATTA